MLAARFACVLLAVAAFAAGPARAQTTGSLKPWSGEDGASGHPEMSAAAIRQAAAEFPNCIARMAPLAARRGISQESFTRFTSDLEPDLRIMDFVDAQPEFSKPIWDYLDTAITDAKVKRGQELLARYRPQFEAVEKTYGVDRHVIAAIWGVETNYSTITGDRSVLRSTATLACIGRRQAYFRDEFLGALEIAHRGDIKPELFYGSWAGAFGATQFMPTAFKRYAVDFDGDGRRDVVGTAEDVFASTANHLKMAGWVSGQTWGYEVRVPAGFNFAYADRNKNFSLGQWQHLGVARANGKPFPRAADQAYLLAPAGAQGPAFLMMQNFRAIMRYNPAEAYALAVGHLSDRLRGGGPLLGEWPRDQRVLSRSERIELQEHLARLGYDIGAPDGRMGGKTLTALRRFQSTVGQQPDGFATASLLDILRRR